MEINIKKNVSILNVNSDMKLFKVNKSNQLRIIKRDRRIVKYDIDRITIAIKKAFVAVKGEIALELSRVQEITSKLITQITELFYTRWPTGGTIYIEAIQDTVEFTLCILTFVKLPALMYSIKKTITNNTKNRKKRRLKA